MARLNKITSGILNVRLHPHSMEIYSQFIQDIYKRRRPEQVHGDRYGMLSALDRSRLEEGWIGGVITTFTRIDKGGAWFDDEGLAEATEEQVSEISIPKNLHPNSAAFYFQFDLNAHRFYFQTYSKGRALTVNSAHALLLALASAPRILEKYGDAKISIVQSHVGLAKMFSLKSIREIKITLQKPNADIFADDFEAQIENHLEETHSKKVVVAYEAELGKSIIPTEEVKAISQAALNNGGVEVKGKDESGAVTLSTAQFPKILQDKYDSNVHTEEQAFRNLIATRVNQ